MDHILNGARPPLAHCQGPRSCRSRVQPVICVCSLRLCFSAVDPTRAQLFYQVARPDLNPYDPFLRLLARYPDDSVIVAKTAHLASRIVGAACRRVVIPDAATFLQWIMQTMQNPSVRLAAAPPKSGAISSESVYLVSRAITEPAHDRSDS